MIRENFVEELRENLNLSRMEFNKMSQLSLSYATAAMARILSLISLQDMFPDKFTERKILSLFIKCPNKDCKWTGELKEKEVRFFTSCRLQRLLQSSRRVYLGLITATRGIETPTQNALVQLV